MPLEYLGKLLAAKRVNILFLIVSADDITILQTVLNMSISSKHPTEKFLKPTGTPVRFPHQKTQRRSSLPKAKPHLPETESH